IAAVHVRWDPVLAAHQGQPPTRVVADGSDAGECDLAGRLPAHQSIVPSGAAARLSAAPRCDPAWAACHPFPAPSQDEARSEYFKRRKTMTYPAVDDLPEEAASTLLDVCGQLSQSRHAGLARWAASVFDALLVQLVTGTTGGPVDVTDTEPCRPLAQLDAAELDGLHWILLAGADASDDESVVEWCPRMGHLIVAEFHRREYEQAVIDAKAAAMEAEE